MRRKLFPFEFLIAAFLASNIIAILIGVDPIQPDIFQIFRRNKNDLFSLINLVAVFDAILTSRQTCENLQCLYENLMSTTFRKTAFLKKISIVN